MKYLMFILLSLFAGLFINDENNDDFEKLWKQVIKEERKLPKSAYAIVEQIYDKALAENRDDHLIKAIIYKAKLSKSFEDKDPADAIKKMEAELPKIKSNSAKAIYCSLLGESYSQYGMQNAYRFQNRSREEESNSSIAQLPFESLEQIQKISIDYYKRSLSYTLDTKLENLELLITDNKEKNVLRALTLEQFLVFRALQHFKDTRSLVSLPTESFTLNSPSLFEYDYKLGNNDLETIPSNDYLQLGIALFQKARMIKDLSSEQLIWLELVRLEYLKSYASVSDKELLYEESLLALGNRFEGEKGNEAIYYKLISTYLDMGSRSRQKDGENFKGYYPKAAKMLKDLESKSSDEYYEEFITSLKERLNKVEFSVQMEQVNLREKAFLSYLQYRNATKLEYSIYRLEGKDFEKYSTKHRPADKINFVKSLKGSTPKELQLPLGNDHEFHSIEFPIEGLASGRYVMMTKHEATFSKDKSTGVVLSLFHVSNLSYVSMNGWDNSEGFVLDRITGKPLENVKVEVSTKEYDQGSRRNVWKKEATLISDSAGRFQYTGEGRSFSYRLVYGDDYLELGDNHYFNNRNKPNNSFQVHLFTDRAIYRPGQSIYYKGLVIGKDHEQLPSIVTYKEVSITFRDANWQILKEETLTTDDYGTFHGVLTAPEGSLTGQMQIQTKIEGRSFQQAVRVEEYKRPKLYAQMDKISKPYALGDTVTMTGTLKSYSGANVSAAKVKYRVEKQEARRWVCYYERGGFQDRTLKQVVSGETKVLEDGTFSIDIPTASSGSLYSRFNYVTHIDFTDATGESTSLTKSLMLSASPFFLSIEMQEQCYEEELKDIKIKALNAEKEEVKVSYDFTVTKLLAPNKVTRTKYWTAPELSYLDEQTYMSLFPHDSYKAEGNPTKWAKEKIVIEKAELYTNSIELNTLKSGAYKIELVATDENGNKLSEERYLFVSSSKTVAFPSQHLWTSDIKDSYQPDQQVNIKVSTPYAQSHLLYRVRKGHETKSTEWKTLIPSRELTLPVTDSDRGGFTLDLVMVKNNRVYTKKLNINVPWTNKALQIEYTTFRDKLLPGVDESWRFTIKDAEGAPITGQLLAAMYDASLDQFLPNKWTKEFYSTSYSYGEWMGKGFGSARSYAFMPRLRYNNFQIRGFQPQLEFFGYNIGIRGGMEWEQVSGRGHGKERAMMKSAPAPEMMESSAGARPDADMSTQNTSDESLDAVTIAQPTKDTAFDEMSIRENLNETVFFFPDLEVKNGEVELNFKMNEALTKWNLLLFAQTKELEYAFDTKEIITQKQLMIEPHLPRFVRQGDKIYINAKVSNLSEHTLQATSSIQLLDARSGEEMNRLVLDTDGAIESKLDAGETKTVEWIFEIPDELTSAIIIKMMTQGGGHSDGEQNIVPVMSNRKLVTETMPMHIQSGATKIFEMSSMDKMLGSETLDNHNFSVELTTNPAWIIAKAIPYLTTAEKPSSQDLFNVIYGNLMMQDILSKNPELRKTIATWKAEDLKSPLSQNQDLKLNALEETPWVRAVQSEEEQMAQLAIFLDDNYVSGQVLSSSNKLKQRQLSNGGFAWMPGGRDNWYITQSILEGIGKLSKLGIVNGFDESITDAAIEYIDRRMIEYYEDNHSRSEKYIEPLAIHYLYVRSFFIAKSMTSKSKQVIEFYLKKGEKYWSEQGSYQQGLLALAAARHERPALAAAIMTSLDERMIRNEEVGYYWNDQAGYYWYNLNIEKQALMIELFQELEGSQEDIDGLKLWLLKNKQTNSWKTTKATSAACYAFLLGSEKWLNMASEFSVSFPLVKEEIVFEQKEYATGYSRKDYGPSLISADKKQIKLSNPNGGVAWGAAYWQYFEDLDKIEDFQDTPLKLVKEIFKVGLDDSGELIQKVSSKNPIVPGDRLRIKIRLQVDRPMEFIEMKDMRSSGLEPVNVLSSYKWQDGLSYYESTKDLATYFYFDFLPKGNWVFEYDVKAAHKGSFSNGITEIQAMYAPEFASHSNGVEITVTKE